MYENFGFITLKTGTTISFCLICINNRENPIKFQAYACILNSDEILGQQSH